MATIQDTEAIEPELKPAEWQELSHLDYFRRKLEEFRERALINGDVFETIGSEIRLRREAIERHGLYRASLSCAQARGMQGHCRSQEVGRACPDDRA